MWVLCAFDDQGLSHIYEAIFLKGEQAERLANLLNNGAQSPFTYRAIKVDEGWLYKGLHIAVTDALD